MDIILKKITNLKNNYYFLSFFLGIIISLVFFLPFILFDKGYFIYYGDFNVQQIPFYRMVHDSILNGEFFWNTKTDLGVNLIGSYSFYLITSPFFWITLIFPSKAVPYLMGPLLILKFGCMSLTSYIYLKRYVRNPNLALLGSLLYAFSGFAIYNIFFNHFLEPMIVFPLLLYGIDKCMYENNRGIVFITVFASCLINYYFFVGQVVFAILYWVFKIVWGDFKFTKKVFITLLIETTLGFLATFVILLPSILSVIQNPRINESFEGWPTLIYNPTQRYIHIIQCLFFPPDIPARPNFTPDSNAKWASLGAWLPLFGMTGVISFLQMKREHWLKKFLALLFTMALIPILNSSFQLFVSSYYARWLYMLTLMTSLSTILALQSSKTDWKRAIKWTTIITASIAFSIGFTKNAKNKTSNPLEQLGLMTYPERFWIYVSISLICILILAIIIFTCENNRKKMIKYFSGSVAIVILFYSFYVLTLGKTQSEDSRNFIIPNCINGGENINLDTKDCRVDVYDGMDNQAMFWQLPTIQAFHSIVPGSIMEFYPAVGVTRDVGSRPSEEYFGIRSLTSCRWLFDNKNNVNHFGGKFNNNPKMVGWKYYDTQNDFYIWENECFIPYGFSYDKFIRRENFDKISEKNRNLAMLKGIVLETEQINKYSDILSEINHPNSLDYSDQSYIKDCKDRKINCCSDFSYNKNGFSAKFENKSENDKIIFFSIPYEKGWSAYIDDVPTDIDKANIGFMAVRVPANKLSNIRFVYMTPGLKVGTFVSILSIIAFIAYLLVYKKFKSSSFSRKKYFFATKEDSDIANNVKRKLP